MIRSVQCLHDYQKRAVTHVLNHKRSMLWLDMGLGKTATSLTAIAHLIDTFEIRAALVIAPLRVVQMVWKQEGAVWDHLQHLNFSLIHGDPMTRVRALRREADVYLVNYENIPWLVNELNNVYLSQGRPLPFDMIIFDEITKTKSARVREGSKRMEPLLQDVLPHIDRRVGLTGTPLPNGYMDLFGQYLVLDDGQRLGTLITEYRDRWFEKYTQYKIDVTETGRRDIHTLISDITLQMDKHDYLELPPVMGGLDEPLEIVVDMPPKARKQYEILEKKMFLELDSGANIEVFNSAGLSNKCLQFANGAVYTGEPGEGIWESVHDAKLDALEELVDSAGTPILLSYNFKHDVAKIMERLGDKAFHLNRKVNKHEANIIGQRFNNGEIPVLIGHPGSIGHGLNFQYGCHTEAFYGLPWSLEMYEQFYARVMERQGQTRPGMVHFIMARDTLDYAVLAALQGKSSDQISLRTAILNYRRTKYEQQAA